MRKSKYRVNKNNLSEGDDYWALTLHNDRRIATFHLSLSCFDDQNLEMDNLNIFLTVDDALNFIVSGDFILWGNRVEVFNYKNPRGKIFVFALKKWESLEIPRKKQQKNSTFSNMKLSNQEYLVVQLMDKGHRNLRIAKEMNINEKTVSTYMRRIYIKSGLAPEYNVHALLIRLKKMRLL